MEAVMVILPVVLWLQSVMLVPGRSVVWVFWVNGVFCCFNGATAVLSVRSPAPVLRRFVQADSRHVRNEQNIVRFVLAPHLKVY